MSINKKKIGIIILIAGLLLGLAGVWFYYSQILTVNYLIPGVHYTGIYNLFFQGADSPKISSILDILGYWGDKRFDLVDLLQKFPSVGFATSTPTSPMTLKSEIQNFFTENGYKTYGWVSVGPDNVIKEIKQFVNEKKKVPVIVLSWRILDEKNNIFLFVPQVVIGIFDSSGKVIVHDYYYGNNYEISYDDFEKTFQSTETGILAVWPSDEIKGSIKGQNYNVAYYPQRSESMDKAGDLLATKNLLAVRFWQLGAFEQSAVAFEELVNDPNFEYLPPAFRVVKISRLAAAYIDLNQFDEAIRIIKEDVLPINQNLSETFEGWFLLPPIDKFSYPYYVLSLAYLKQGKRELAFANYKELNLIHDSIREKVGEDFYFIRPPRIEELEKEISSQK